MTPDRWKQIEHLLDEVLAHPARERTAFLAEASAGDAALRREVEAMLAAEEVAPAFLNADAAAFVAPALDILQAPMDYVGQRLGVYRLTRQIGMGGMSLVYLAERDDEQFSKQVAVKLLRHPGRHPDLVARLRAERQILASLSHPHIAQVFDGGVTEGGWPYLVMEYIDGQPITDYCKAHVLSLPERLALIGQVAEAVQHAHQRLIVHRDLKPSNILVTEDDAGHPHVKLLDFGIAKLLDEEAAGVPMTGTGLRLMTPQYAAPEQIRGETVTTATDVYALGVVLYELLTGQRPYTLEGKTPSEVERIVCEQEPTRPSTAVTTEGSGARLVDRRKHQLRGDLDTIVMKALRKEPEMRYTGVGELLEDLRRYRSGLPVLAREATMGYRVRKFIGRHRAGVAMAAVFVVLVLGFAVAMAAQQQATAQQRDRAQVEAQKAQELTSFMLGLFEANEPSSVPTDTITARTLLARGVERAREMEGQPAVQAEMLMTVGRAYRVLGRYDQAEPLLREALAIQRTHLGGTHTAVATSLDQLGRVLHERGAYVAADSFHHAALVQRRNLFGERHPDVASSLNELGLAHWYQGNLEVADSLTRLALDLALDLLGDEDPRTITMMSDLANIRREMGDYPAAESLQRDVLALRQRVLGERHISVADDFNHLGTLMTRQGDYEAADSFYHAALVLYRELLGETHSNVATVVSNLAVVKGYEGDYEAAEQFMREALVLQRRILGDRHPFVATAMDNLGALLGLKGEYDAALALHRQGLALRRDLMGEEHPSVATSLSNVANVLSYLGRYSDAEPLYHEALAIKRDALGAEHPEVTKIMYNLAAALHKQRNFAEAESLYQHVLALDQQLLGAEHSSVGLSRMKLATVLSDRGDYEAAEGQFRKALDLIRRVLPEAHPRLAESLNAFGVLLTRKGAYSEAEQVLDEALRLRRAQLGENHPDTRNTREHLASLYDAWGQPDKATAYRAMNEEE